MASLSQSSDPVDPLHSHSYLSFFPRAFKASTDAPNPDLTDLDSINNFIKSTASRSPGKLVDEAKRIVDSEADTFNSNIERFTDVNDDNLALNAKVNGSIQERRPALGRKRAKFSLKPSASQPSVSLEPNLDIDQLQDPEEYFLAHEKIENAHKELQRQRAGRVNDSNGYNPITTARHRRPGILGKSVSYKHRYSSVLYTQLSSQEILKQEIHSPTNYDLSQDTIARGLGSGELVAINGTENRINGLLDEIFSRDDEILDGDGALSLLQEHFQIKPMDLDKLSLPDFHEIGRNDFMAVGERLPNPRKSLADIQNLVRQNIGRTPVKNRQAAVSPLNSVASPTPPQSPFASLSLLKKHILQSNQRNDPFSGLNIDPFPARHLSSIEHDGKQLDQIDTWRNPSISRMPKSRVEHEIIKSNTDKGPQNVLAEDPVYPMDNVVSDNLKGLVIDIGQSKSHDDSGDHAGSHFSEERIKNEAVGKANISANVQPNGSNATAQYAEDMFDIPAYQNDTMEENLQTTLQEAEPFAQPDINPEDSTTEKLKRSQSQSDQDGAMDGHSTIPENGPDQVAEEDQSTSLNEQSKAKGPPRKKRQRKELSHRQSLAAAGTSMQTGVRRSTRKKMRPLEYWKGERFLYGRVHQSLATVIGVKYVSPAEDGGKPNFTVESYVSDKYKDLVELAALH